MMKIKMESNQFADIEADIFIQTEHLSFIAKFLMLMGRDGLKGKGLNQFF